MGLRHVVLLTFHAETEPAQIDAIIGALEALPGHIDEIRSFDVRTDAGLSEGNADLVIVADFDDADAWRRYQDHPEHQRVLAELIRPSLAGRCAAQFVT